MATCDGNEKSVESLKIRSGFFPLAIFSFVALHGLPTTCLSFLICRVRLKIFTWMITRDNAMKMLHELHTVIQ